MSWISSAVGGALASIGTIVGNISGDRTAKKIGLARGTDPKYEESQYAKSRLGLAQQLINSRGPGAAMMEKNIYAQQANQTAQIDRNATDSTQALLLGAANQGRTDQNFQNLGLSEAQDYYRRLDNLNSANEGMTQEHHASFDDKVRRWQDDIKITMAKNQIRQQQGQSLANLGSIFMGSSFGGGGGGKGK